MKTDVFWDVTPCVLVEVANVSGKCRNSVTAHAFDYWQTVDICGNVINAPYHRHVVTAEFPVLGQYLHVQVGTTVLLK